MKSTLGKITLLTILFCVSLFGSTQLASYKLTNNKKSLHTKEPLLLTFTAKQKDHNDNMFFEFTIQKSPDYEVKLLHKTIHDNSFHNTTTTFEYVLFALKAKTLHVNFNFIIQTASDKAVKQSYVDDHDNSVGISTLNTKVAIKPLIIKVKKMLQPVDLVGDYTLSSNIDKSQINQYGVVNLHYTLMGRGYKEPHLNLLNTNINNVTVFSKIQDKSSKLTENAYSINRKYIYAITAKSDFTVPAVSLEAYSPNRDKYYTLRTKPYMIKVKKIDTATLIDKIDAPSTKSFINFEEMKEFFIYVMLFLSGFFTAKLSQKSFFNKEKKRGFEDIQNTKTLKELLMLLVLHYQGRGLDEYISKIEADANDGHPLNLKKIKKEILSKLM